MSKIIHKNHISIGSLIVSLFSLTSCGGSSGENNATVVGNPPSASFAVAFDQAHAIAKLRDPNSKGRANVDVEASISIQSKSDISLALDPTQSLASAGNESEAASEDGPTRLLAILGDGTTLDLENDRYKVISIRGARGGFIMHAQEKGPDDSDWYDQPKLYFSRLDGRVFPLVKMEKNPDGYEYESEYSWYEVVGQTTSKDLIFSDGHYLEYLSGNIKRLPINFGEMRISKIVGNFLIVSPSSGGSFTQVFNIKTGTRYNVEQALNGYALSGTRMRVSYWGGVDDIFDLQTREYSSSNLTGFDVHLEIEDGVVGSSAYCPAPLIEVVAENPINQDDPNPDATVPSPEVVQQPMKLQDGEYWICHLSPDGTPTTLSTTPMREKDILRGSGPYFVLQTPTAIKWFERSEGKFHTILEGVNTLDVKVSGEYAFYRAESESGELSAGVYDMEIGENFEISTKLGPLEDIQLMLQ